MIEIIGLLVVALFVFILAVAWYVLLRFAESLEDEEKKVFEEFELW